MGDNDMLKKNLDIAKIAAEDAKQAQKLAEAESNPAAAPRRGAGEGQSAAPAGKRQLPPASFASIVQAMMTQALFYLGDIATASGEAVSRGGFGSSAGEASGHGGGDAGGHGAGE